jgi:hypothetical protein
MSNIKEITPDPNVARVDRKPTTPVKESKETLRDDHIQSLTESGRDVVQVDARRAEDARLEENARLLLEELPDGRPDRVAEAKRKLAEGFYDRPEVLEETAGKITQDRAAQKAAIYQVNPHDVARAKTRLAQGYYEQPEVLDETARRIVKKGI